MVRDAEIRADVRSMKGDDIMFIGYVRGLLGAGNDPHTSRLAALALAEHKLMTYGENA